MKHMQAPNTPNISNNTDYQASEPLYTVGEVAQELNLTVRTLHYWESLGLVEPQWRSWANYRLYSAHEIERLQQVMIYRATGMKLAEIKALLEGEQESLEHLRRQRARLEQQRAGVEAMLQAVETLLEKHMNKEELNLQQIGEILGDANFAEHQQEAEQRYGDSQDWQVSQQRTAKWTAQDWEANKQRFAAIDARLAQAAREAIPTDSPEAAALVVAHREVLSEFFPVTPAKHYLISRGYIADPRFRSYYEQQQPGLAQWLADAIAHVAQEQGVDLEQPTWE